MFRNVSKQQVVTRVSCFETGTARNDDNVMAFSELFAVGLEAFWFGAFTRHLNIQVKVCALFLSMIHVIPGAPSGCYVYVGV